MRTDRLNFVEQAVEQFHQEFGPEFTCHDLLQFIKSQKHVPVWVKFGGLAKVRAYLIVLKRKGKLKYLNGLWKIHSQEVNEQ